MASASAARTRRKAQRKKAAAQRRRLPIFWIEFGVVVVLFGAAIVMTRSDSKTQTPAAGVEETRAAA